MTESRPKLTILEQRRIEAGIVKPIYETLERELGRKKAQELLGKAIRQAARDSGREFAAEEKDGTSLESFAVLFERWKEGGAYDFELLEQNAENFNFNIRRCAYAEMYHEMGLGPIGHLLSCQRDGALCEGYDPKIEMTRTQTVMQGASHCDFRFRYRKD